MVVITTRVRPSMVSGLGSSAQTTAAGLDKCQASVRYMQRNALFGLGIRILRASLLKREESYCRKQAPLQRIT